MTASSEVLDRPPLPVRRLELNGLVTELVEAGDPAADLVMLLHDGAWGGSNTVSWGHCIDELARDFHVVAPDLLGFGNSDKVVFFDRSPASSRVQQILALLKALGAARKSVHLVGTSFGGSVALRLAVQATGAHYGLRSVTSIGGTGGGSWKTLAMSTEMSRWDGTRHDLARIVRLLVPAEFDIEEQLELRWRSARTPGHYRSVASLGTQIPDGIRTIPDDPWPAQLHDVSTPILLLAGRQDALLLPTWTDHVIQAAPNARVQHLDSGHSPNVDQPLAVADRIKEFIADVTA